MRAAARRSGKARHRRRADARWLQHHSEDFRKFLAAERRNLQRAALARPLHPIAADKMRAHSRADMTGEMRAPLAPIEARTAKDAARFCLWF
jgi:hypothetical protein